MELSEARKLPAAKPSALSKGVAGPCAPSSGVAVSSYFLRPSMDPSEGWPSSQVF